LQYESFEVFLLGSGLSNFCRQLSGYHHNTFGVARQNVAGVHGNPRASDRHLQINGMMQDEIGAGGDASREDRKLHPRDLRRVTHGAVGDERRRAASCEPGGEVCPALAARPFPRQSMTSTWPAGTDSIARRCGWAGSRNTSSTSRSSRAGM
jgi:hypothetical protein